MVKKLEDEVINTYDNILSGLKHVYSLNLKEKNVKNILEFHVSMYQQVQNPVLRNMS